MTIAVLFLHSCQKGLGWYRGQWKGVHKHGYGLLKYKSGKKSFMKRWKDRYGILSYYQLIGFKAARSGNLYEKKRKLGRDKRGILELVTQKNS